ncbi:MarR family transcriptional regulator [Legionella pneumophila serogroup 1]|uniref:MarR family winged helix-turn-helix transcriptional regulator n=1 Tax=Legionella TaxID=445 RepID=UPI0007708096|nr:MULTISPECIES: MarR family transcriptional regulator [Legionella]HAT8859958.1 MarR family transcriptional regulator [Legionella pneumophila subsp. pneumophila]MCW8395272.1 MarR family transcriptional regulator [Legionella sp. PATHC039]QIB24034.1 MarR family transcriptional regulator [Legionella pneumophila]CZH15593.1 Salmolysin [Legionella pneumophila]HAT8641413.1 MarR family transcriptional regulator [Legionella pneumophila]
MYLSSLLKKTNRLLIKRANELIKPYAMSHAYTYILMELYIENGLTQSELVQLIEVEQPTLVRTLDRMERDGFITRKPSSMDRRVVHIFLTEKARLLQEKIDECSRILNDEILAGFSEDEKTKLQELTHRVLDNLRNPTE